MVDKVETDTVLPTVFHDILVTEVKVDSHYVVYEGLEVMHESDGVLNLTADEIEETQHIELEELEVIEHIYIDVVVVLIRTSLTEVTEVDHYSVLEVIDDYEDHDGVKVVQL